MAELVLPSDTWLRMSNGWVDSISRIKAGDQVWATEVSDTELPDTDDAPAAQRRWFRHKKVKVVRVEPAGERRFVALSFINIRGIGGGPCEPRAEARLHLTAEADAYVLGYFSDYSRNKPQDRKFERGPHDLYKISTLVDFDIGDPDDPDTFFPKALPHFVIPGTNWGYFDNDDYGLRRLEPDLTRTLTLPAYAIEIDGDGPIVITDGFHVSPSPDLPRAERFEV